MTTVALLALVPHAPHWTAAATRDMHRVRRALGGACRGIHHVGSTSVPGIAASPVVDLLVEVHSFDALQTAALRLSAHGFVAQAEQVAHRRTYHVDDPVTRRRRVELHCYETDHPEAKGLLAFYACLRAYPEVARTYEALKREGRVQHGHDVQAYLAIKRAWSEGVAQAALAFRPRGGGRGNTTIADTP